MPTIGTDDDAARLTASFCNDWTFLHLGVGISLYSILVGLDADIEYDGMTIELMSNAALLPSPGRRRDDDDAWWWWWWWALSRSRSRDLDDVAGDVSRDEFGWLLVLL
jgi:hypothetical protein